MTKHVTFFHHPLLTLLLLSTSADKALGFHNSPIGSPLLVPLESRVAPTIPFVSAQSDHPKPEQLARRQFWQFLTNSLAASSLILSSPSNANAASSTVQLEPYTDYIHAFRLVVPTSWEKTTQQLSGRRTAVFFTDRSSPNIDTLLLIAFTPIRDDFTSLGSFGSVDQVAQATILPKGGLAGRSDESKMISAVSKRNAYYFDYTTTPVVDVEAGTGSGSLTRRLEPLHFRTIFTLVPSGDGAAGLTLVTITMQTLEEKYERTWKGTFDEIVESFERVSV